MKAVEMMLRRTKIEALQQVQYTLDLGLMDLIEESTRINKNNDKEKDKSRSKNQFIMNTIQNNHLTV